METARPPGRQPFDGDPARVNFGLHISVPHGMIRMEATMAAERIPSYPKNARDPLGRDAAATRPRARAPIQRVHGRRPVRGGRTTDSCRF